MLDRLPEKIAARIEAHEGGCWLWTGALTNGYGSLTMDGTSYAHRVVYGRLVEPVPKGKALHHTCANRHCVNPEHLRVLTPSAHSRLHNVGQTHCKRGHEFTPENTYWYARRGYRLCRACMRHHARRRYQRLHGLALDP